MKNDYKKWQESVVSSLIKRTDNLPKKLTKTDLALQIGISFPTLKKIYDGGTDVSIPILYSWCDAIECEPSDIFNDARRDHIVKEGSERQLSDSELIYIMPDEVLTSMRGLFESFASNYQSSANK